MNPAPGRGLTCVEAQMNKEFTATLVQSEAKLKAELRKVIGKEAGDTVTVCLQERLGRPRA